MDTSCSFEGKQLRYFITAYDRVFSIADFAKILGVSYKFIHSRLIPSDVGTYK